MDINLTGEHYAGADTIPAQVYDGPGVEVTSEVYEKESVSEREVVLPLFGKAVKWIVYAAIFLTPLLFLSFTNDTLEINKQFLLLITAGVGLVLYLIDIIRTGFIKIRPTNFYWFILAMLAAGTISLVTSIFRWTSLFGSNASRADSFVVLLSLAILFFLAINTDEDNGQTMQKVFGLSLVVTLLYGSLQLLGIFIVKGSFAVRFFNSTGSLNSLGILGAISLTWFNVMSLSAGKDGNKSKLIWNIISYAGFVLGLFVLLALSDWKLWTVAILSTIASVGLSPMNAGSMRRRMMRFALPMAITVLGVLVLLLNFTIAPIKNNLPPDAQPKMNVSYNIALSAIKDKPFGFGLENFGIAYDKYKPSDITGAVQETSRTIGAFIFSNKTTQVSTWITEGGIPMALALVALLVFSVLFTIKQIKNNFNNDQQAGRIWAIFLGLILSLFLISFNITLMTVLFMVLALSVITTQAHEFTFNLETEAKYSFIGSIAFVIGLVAAIIGGYFMATTYLSNIHLAKAYEAKDFDQSINELVTSANLTNKDDTIYQVLAQALINKFTSDNKSGAKKGESQQDYVNRLQNTITSAINAATLATNINPANARNWIVRANVYQNLVGIIPGADQEALKNYDEALARDPDDPTIYFQKSNTSLANAQFINTLVLQNSGVDINAARQQFNASLVQAEESLKKTIELDKNFGQAVLNLGLVYDNEDKLPEAIQQFEKLQPANPNDPSIPFELGVLYYRNNQKDKAFDAWQRAVALFPDYSNARWYLSLLYEERGDLQNALAQVTEVEKSNPDNQAVKDRIAALEAGTRIIPPQKVLDQKPIQ